MNLTATLTPLAPDMADRDVHVHPIGWIRSSLKSTAEAPRQGFEGGPDAWLDVLDDYAAGLTELRAGQEVTLITWLHQAQRDVLRVHPRDDPAIPLTGVFSTRSADRPNPIGLHQVRILRIDGTRIEVGPLEAVDGTPVLDIKPVLQGGPSPDAASWPADLDALIAAPTHHTLQFENAAVRVLDTRIPAGSRTPVHYHRWPSVLHVISWSSFVRRDQEGAVTLDSRLLPQLTESPGTFWSPPLMAHSLENVGATDLRVIAVEVKHPAT